MPNALRVDVRAGFVGWSGACWGRSACVTRLARPRELTARFGDFLSSWNRHVRCTPTLTTLPALLGDKTSADGGALESGGAFSRT